MSFKSPRGPGDIERKWAFEVADERVSSHGYGWDRADIRSANGKKNVASLVGVQLSRLIGLHEGDRRTFDFFISHTAPRLAGAWDKV